MEGCFEFNGSLLVLERVLRPRRAAVRLGVLQVAFQVSYLCRFLDGDAASLFIPGVYRVNHNVAFAGVYVGAACRGCVLFRSSFCFCYLFFTVVWVK